MLLGKSKRRDSMGRHELFPGSSSGGSARQCIVSFVFTRGLDNKGLSNPQRHKQGHSPPNIAADQTQTLTHIMSTPQRDQTQPFSQPKTKMAQQIYPKVVYITEKLVSPQDPKKAYFVITPYFSVPDSYDESQHAYTQKLIPSGLPVVTIPIP